MDTNTVSAKCSCLSGNYSCTSMAYGKQHLENKLYNLTPLSNVLGMRLDGSQSKCPRNVIQWLFTIKMSPLVCHYLNQTYGFSSVHLHLYSQPRFLLVIMTLLPNLIPRLSSLSLGMRLTANNYLVWPFSHCLNLILFESQQVTHSQFGQLSPICIGTRNSPLVILTLSLYTPNVRNEVSNCLYLI